MNMLHFCRSGHIMLQPVSQRPQAQTESGALTAAILCFNRPDYGSNDTGSGQLVRQLVIALNVECVRLTRVGEDRDAIGFLRAVASNYANRTECSPSKGNMYVVTTRSVSSYSSPVMLTITVMFSNGHGRSIPRARRAALEPFHLPERMDTWSSSYFCVRCSRVTILRPVAD